MSLAHAVAQLRHLYVQLLEERVKSQVHAAVGLLGPAIEEIERAQAASPPSTEERTACQHNRRHTYLLGLVSPEKLRALLAVARAAKALRKRLEPYSDVDSLWEEDKKLVRSLSRLDALSKGRGR